MYSEIFIINFKLHPTTLFNSNFFFCRLARHILFWRWNSSLSFHSFIHFIFFATFSLTYIPIAISSYCFSQMGWSKISPLRWSITSLRAGWTSAQAASVGGWCLVWTVQSVDVPSSMWLPETKELPLINEDGNWWPWGLGLTGTLRPFLRGLWGLSGAITPFNSTPNGAAPWRDLCLTQGETVAP